MTVRVLQALTGGQYGGTELSIHALSAGLAARGVATTISVLDGGGPVVDRFLSSGLTVHNLEGHRGYVHASRRLARLLRSERFDVVHLYGFRMSLLGRMVAHMVRPRPRVVHGIRGLHVTEGAEPESRHTRVAVAVERLAAPWIDAYIANSDGAVRYLTHHGVPADRFTVIRNGIDIGRWARESIERDDPPLVVTVANFRPVKRLEDLIDALALLKARGRDFRAVVVGDGLSRPLLESKIETLGLGDLVLLPGQLAPEAIRSMLSRASLFALPSLWEGMPGSVIEAMALELPVVATDVSGINEVVMHGHTGLLVPARTPAALADAIEQLLDSPDTRLRMGAAGRRRVAEEFEITRMVDRHVAAYRSLVGWRQT